MLEAGRYKARGVEAALGFTSTGKEQVAVLLETADGQQITWYGYFTEKTAESTLDSLRTLGWSSDDLSDLTGIDQNEVTIVVEHEEDQDGKPRARVRWINSGGGLAMKETMDPSAAKAFAARMKGAAVASRARARASAPASPPTRQGGGGTGYRRNEPLPPDYGTAFDDEPPPF